MFGWIDKTWNPVVGCEHECTYCWARKLATGKLRKKPRYQNGFKPQRIEKELDRRFHNKVVFVSDMGDLFGDWVPSKWIEDVVEAVKNSPSSTFLLLTKNPKRFKEFVKIFPGNVILGATIETNEELHVSSSNALYRTQSRYNRYLSLKTLCHPRKFIAIEPILEFNPDVFGKWIKEIKPEKVSISYDNYRNKLTVPAEEKTIRFAKRLAKFTLVLPHGNWVENPSTKKKLLS